MDKKLGITLVQLSCVRDLSVTTLSTGMVVVEVVVPNQKRDVSRILAKVGHAKVILVGAAVQIIVEDAIDNGLILSADVKFAVKKSRTKIHVLLLLVLQLLVNA